MKVLLSRNTTRNGALYLRTFSGHGHHQRTRNFTQKYGGIALLLFSVGSFKFCQVQEQSPSIMDENSVNGYSFCAAGSAEESKGEKKERVLKMFGSMLNSDQIETDPDELERRSKPWNSYHSSSQLPFCILSPESTEDVSKIMQICHRESIPVVPFGGGTSLEGHTLSIGSDCMDPISIDFSNMSNILSFNKDDLDIRVQAGLGYIALNDYLREYSLWFPLDPGPGASVGGMCACRCSGSTAVRYGSMRENVLNITAVLADGTIVNTGSRARKSSAGYDLTRLLVGSEGTLAVITEVTLKLHIIPSFKYAMKIPFSTMEGATACARDTLKCGVTVGRCELLDENMIKIMNQTTPDLKWNEKTTLLYEITGLSHSSVEEQMEVVRQIAIKNGAFGQISILTDPDQCDALWKQRKECLWSAMACYPDKEPMITDTAVPLTRLPEMMTRTRELLDSAQNKYPSPIIAHAGDGNSHVLLFFDPKNPSEVQEVKQLAHKLASMAIEMDGTCTGEHGIGVGKKALLKKEMGEGSMQMMTRIKSVMDPQNILNPDKILDRNVK